MAIFRDDAGNRYFAANVVAEDSWLREHESYEWFVRGVEYAASQTLAIPALAVCAPEDLYYAVRAILRGAGLPQPTEIARLTRELEEARRERSIARAAAMDAQAGLRRAERALEEARERERALREALEEASDDLADMHEGLECRFNGGDGCLACMAQGRIGDALAATELTEASDGE